MVMVVDVGCRERAARRKAACARGHRLCAKNDLPVGPRGLVNLHGVELFISDLNAAHGCLVG